MLKIQFAIDRGGTFTDIYAFYNNKIVVEKLLSVDLGNYTDGVAEGIRRILEKHHLTSNDIEWIRMGTTVATNAMLERGGVRTALAVTKGFKDILVINEQTRESLFDLNIKKRENLYEEVFEVDERLIYDNEDGSLHIEVPLDREQIKSDLQRLRSKGIISLAISLLHAYKEPTREQEIAQLAKEVGFEFISLSSDIAPSIKLVDRTQTTVLDAYLTPHIQNYIENFKKEFDGNLANIPLFFMQSHGGLINERFFKASKAILSGPAGGVVGLASMYEGVPLIGFDMGGTSSDVARFDGTFEVSYENKINNYWVKTPQLDILTVASGGGSRLFFDNKMFRVGPESSGASPGPVCYKKGGFLSITDANLVLGRVLPSYFPHIFGTNRDEPLGRIESIEAFEHFRDEINGHYLKEGLSPLSLEEVALGFIEVANDTMMKPILEVSTAKGFDIRTHHLVAFGGAGGQHAVAMARALGISRVRLHRYGGILSAFGLGRAEVIEIGRAHV